MLSLLDGVHLQLHGLDQLGDHPGAQQRYGIIRILALLVLSLWLRGVSIIFNITRIYMNLIGKVATIPGPSLTNFDRVLLDNCMQTGGFFIVSYNNPNNLVTAQSLFGYL